MKSSSDALSQLRLYLEAWRPTAQALAEAVCVTDLDGCIQFANGSLQRMLGCEESDLLDEPVSAFARCLPHGRPIDLREEREFAACTWRRSDGGAVVGRCSLRPILLAGKPVGACLVASPASLTDTAAPRDSAPAVVVPSALSAESKRIERRLQVIEAVGAIATAQLTLDELLRALLDSMHGEMGLETVAIFLVDEAGQTLTVRGAIGTGTHISDQVRAPIGHGLLADVMEAGVTRYIPDIRPVVQQTPLLSDDQRAEVDQFAALMVPLIVEQRPIGVLYVGSSGPSQFDPEDVRLIELVGMRAALAIERTRAVEAAGRAHERLQFLNDAGVTLSSTLDYSATTNSLADILTPTLSEACAVYLLGDDGRLSKVQTRATGEAEASLRPLMDHLDAMVDAAPDAPSAVGRSVWSQQVIAERQPCAESEDDAADDASSACLCAPLVVRQHALGAIYLARCPGREFSAGDVALIQGLAERAAGALDNARLFIETQEALAIGSATATQLDTIINSTDVGIFVTDAEGDEMRVNPYGAHLLGLPAALTARRSEHPNVPFEIRTTEGEHIPLDREPIYIARTEGRPIEARFVIHRFDTGKDIQALTRCTPLFDRRQRVVGAIGVVTDITEVYELERHKDEFVGIASHELKTPLTTLKILSQLLGRKLEASGELSEAEQARRMLVSITRMERLINDLLDVTLIREGQLPLRSALFDLNTVCVEVIGEQELLHHRRILFTTPPDARLLVVADRERIYQVLTNLLSNAIKFSPSTEPVYVRARRTETECIVTVHDHGPGVPPEALPSVFDRYYRVPVMQVQSGSGFGLGLGLHISKEIIDRHGGRIWAESKLGHGSEFSFALARADETDELTWESYA